MWLSPDLAWHAAEGTGRRGRPPTFSDAAIQAVLTLKVLYQLPLRAAQGMAGSLIRLAGLDWRVLHYSTLSRRQKNLTVVIPYRPRGGPLHLVIGSTGLKVLGEGEWKVRRHVADKRRVWRMVHLVIDADRHEIRAVEMTDHGTDDGGQVGPLLERMDGPVASFTADGAYDRDDVHAEIMARHPDAETIVSPRSCAVPSASAETIPTARDRHLQAIAERGRMGWQRASGYNWRALVEADVSRWKRVIGDGLRSQTDGRQATEVAIAAEVLNHMLDLGRPEYVRIA